MRLVEVYKKICSDYEVIAQYSETGNNKYGKIFYFQNTNYRKFISFITNYHTFKEGADGVDRSSWEKNPKHGQEKLKQHVNNMIKSRLFSKNEQTYYSTRKGEIIEKISDGFSEEEQWIILYLLLIDGYFNDTPNYILKQTDETISNFLVYINSVDKINLLLKNFIIDTKMLKLEEMLKEDYIYLDTFHLPFKNIDFFANYYTASQEEKIELHDYIISNYLEQNELINKSKNIDLDVSSSAKNLLLNIREDCISKKYKTSGNFNKTMVRDNAILLYLSNFINFNKFLDFREFIRKTVQKYSEVESIDSGKVLNFIFNEKEMFEMSYINLFCPNYFDEIQISDDISDISEEDFIEETQTKTVIENIKTVNKISSILKRKALERVSYKCELEDYCNCSSHYFTNKITHQNYMEVHHLIPREFSNDFEHSIEQIENYISLCPRCHRFVHYAVDRERKNALHNLYNKRIGKLNMKGINVSESQLKKYYRIEE